MQGRNADRLGRAPRTQQAHLALLSGNADAAQTQLVEPLFLFSLPRSGSTLVQRVLSAHPEISTTSEPWILLPFLAPLHSRLPGGSARDPLVHSAVQDFIAELPGGLDQYRREIRELALRLYSQAAGPGSRFFLDKSPMYHLVARDVIDVFPDGRFLFLWRNPLAAVASMAQLFDAGAWRVQGYAGALFGGLTRLIDAYESNADRVHGVRYEDLVTGDAQTWTALTSYIGVPFDPAALESFSDVTLRGRMGDPVGTALYRELSSEPLTKWHTVFHNPVRRAWAHRYLDWIGARRLGVMGFDLAELKADLDALDTTGGSLRDAVTLGVSLGRDLVKARMPPPLRAPSGWRSLLGTKPPR